MTLTACGQNVDSPAAGSKDNGSVDSIVVLEFGALDTIQALGVSDKVVGIPKGGVVPESLSEFADDKYADVGTMQEPNIEKIAELDPDLVIAGFRNQSLVPELQKNFNVLDITYDQNQPFVDGASEAATKIGEALGMADEVEAKLADFRENVEAAKAEVPEGATALVVMSSGGKLSALAPTGRYSLIYNDLGFTPAIADVNPDSHGDPISFEGIQKANPDYLFVLDRDAAIGQEGGEAAEQVLDNALVHETTAWQEDQVVYLDGARWYIMIHGLDNVQKMLEDVTEKL